MPGLKLRLRYWKPSEAKRMKAVKSFAGAAGGEPAFDPDEQHAGEEDVGEGEGCEEECGPGCERRSGDGDADVGGDESEGADDGGCAEQSEEDARGEVAREAEREADDGVDVEAEAGWGEVEDGEIQRTKMAQVRTGSIARRPEETRKNAPIAGADDWSEGDDADDRGGR